MLRWFHENLNLSKQYNKFMGYYETLGQISRILGAPIDPSQVVYLTQYHVIKASSKKERVISS